MIKLKEKFNVETGKENFKINYNNSNNIEHLILLAHLVTDFKQTHEELTNEKITNKDVFNLIASMMKELEQNERK